MLDPRLIVVQDTNADRWSIRPFYPSEADPKSLSAEILTASKNELLNWLGGPVRKMYVKPNAVLRVRQGAAGSVILGKLEQGTELIVTLNSTSAALGGVIYEWVKIIQCASNVVLEGGFVALQYLIDTFAIPAPPPVLPKFGIGLNFCGPGAAHRVYQLQDKMRAANKKIGPCVIINQPDVVPGLDSEWVVYRVHPGGGRAEPDPFNWNGKYWTPLEWFNFWLPSLSVQREGGKKLAKGFHNELGWRGQMTVRVAWEREFMTICRNAGHTILYGNFAVDGFSKTDVPALRPMIEQGMTQGHVLGINTYWYASLGDDGARARLGYANELVSLYPNLIWLIKELGSGEADAAYPGRDLEVKIITEALSLYGYHKGLTGFALFAANGSGGGWPLSDVPEGDLPAIVSLAPQ